MVAISLKGAKKCATLVQSSRKLDLASRGVRTIKNAGKMLRKKIFENFSGPRSTFGGGHVSTIQNNEIILMASAWLDRRALRNFECNGAKKISISQSPNKTTILLKLSHPFWIS